MTGRIILTLMLVATVAACARVQESRLNPFNWFGRSERSNVVVTAENADPRRLVAQVITLWVEPVPGGAIIRATGLPQRQGYYDGALLPVRGAAPEPGVLSYEFRISAPLEQTRISTQRSREVVVGRFVSDQTLEGIRQIRVSAATNALAVRR